MPGSSWIPYAPQGVKGFNDDQMTKLVSKYGKLQKRNKKANFRIRTVHLDIIKVLFIHQLMHQ